MNVQMNRERWDEWGWWVVWPASGSGSELEAEVGAADDPAPVADDLDLLGPEVDLDAGRVAERPTVVVLIVVVVGVVVGRVAGRARLEDDGAEQELGRCRGEDAQGRVVRDGQDRRRRLEECKAGQGVSSGRSARGGSKGEQRRQARTMPLFQVDWRFPAPPAPTATSSSPMISHISGRGFSSLLAVRSARSSWAWSMSR